MCSLWTKKKNHYDMVFMKGRRAVSLRVVPLSQTLPPSVEKHSISPKKKIWMNSVLPRVRQRTNPQAHLLVRVLFYPLHRWSSAGEWDGAPKCCIPKDGRSPQATDSPKMGKGQLSIPSHPSRPSLGWPLANLLVFPKKGAGNQESNS